MKNLSYPILRKVIWLLLAVFLMAAQFAFAAELTPEELMAMPAVSITYYMQEGGEPMVMDAAPTLTPLGKAYWAMIPAQAFSFPMTLNITASETAPYTFIPASGETLVTDLATVDYEGTSTLITAYQNDVMVDTYWLYVSTVEMPLIVEPAEVPVYYVDSENNANVLHYEVVLAYYDQDNIITADTGLVPANYTLVGDASAAVTVNETGQATPEWVTFYFQPQAVQGTLTVYYTDQYGAEIASSQTKTLDPGTYTIYPEPSGLPSGYVLSADSPSQVDVTVTSTGEVSQEVVTFMYEPQIVTGILTVNYTDESGTPLVAPEMLELSTGDHTVTPNPVYVPTGYVLSGMSQTQFSVNVNSQGGVTPTSVTFYYVPEQVTPVTGTLAVYYTDLGGVQIISPETRTLEQGQHTITPNSAAIPSGYTLSASSQPSYTVTVDATGAVSPASVTFLYEPVQQTATGTLTIQYLDASGTQVGAPQTVSLATGSHTVAINTSTIPSGYTLDASSPTEFTVTVDSAGVVSPSTVAFILAATQTATPTPTPTESPAVTATPTPTESPAETATPTPTASAFDPASYADYAAVGETARTNKSSVNLRSTPDSDSSTNIVSQVPQGTEVWVYGTFTSGGTLWAYASYNSTDCFVWNSLLDLVVEVTPTPTATPYDPTSFADYTAVGQSARTNTTSVNLRSTPDSTSTANLVAQVPQGTEVWVYGTFTSGSTQWAYASYNNTDCYVWYSLLDLVVEETPTVAPTDTPTPAPTNTPAPVHADRAVR